MNKYELTAVISGKATPAKKKSAIEKIKKFVDSFKGKVVEVEEWGKIDLMYKIEGNDSGIFTLFKIELDPLEVKKLSDKLKSEGEILRFLIVKP
ncbi:MAG: 30S ribosomal protein S6 [Candidatus Woesebacteria bacterium GW2011_GWA1_39_21]|uniref:Small ribosomal subunit protein bS6 n=1 Tax=Candidatus Woesebacteria bacterium GW2011_GWA1_39_21 TaxID=1618550 RepID=A0A0G0N708_9BACT|nr:MAG: 30S ribosomal protein S6 [Candidatus Woesebacteria bacterium GW2011_GWA1_39_21]